MYGTIKTDAGSPIFDIPGLLHWHESSQLQMNLQYAWNQRTTHPFLWFKTDGCEWMGDINVCIIKKQGLAYRHGWTNHTTYDTLYNDLPVGPTRDYLFIGIGHYVQTLEPYWALPFWIIKRSRENTGLSIWIIMRTRDLIYILIYILMKWLPIDFPHCNITMFFYFYFFF